MNTVRKILAVILFFVAIFTAGYTIFVHDSRFITGLLLVAAVLIFILAFVLWIQSKIKHPKERAVKSAEKQPAPEIVPSETEKTVSQEQAKEINLQQGEASDEKKEMQQDTTSEEK